MGDYYQRAQAAELVGALCHQLDDMTTRLHQVERQGVKNTRSCAIRLEAAALRKDLGEAQRLIDRLKRRYLDGDDRTQQQHPAGRQRLAAHRSSNHRNRNTLIYKVIPCVPGFARG
ncbi:MAG: hypothetical protein WBV80_25740 [Mycobacterium sp.]